MYIGLESISVDDSPYTLSASLQEEIDCVNNIKYPL